MLRHDVRKGLAVGVGGGVAAGTILLAAGFKYYIGGVFFANGWVEFPAIMRVLLVLIFMAFGFASVSRAATDRAEAQGAARRVHELVHTEPVIDALSTAGEAPAARAAGRIELRDVHFAYPSRMELPVYQGLNLTIEAGQTVALAGPSGCGKSTVVSLLERFYDADAGAVLLDGVDVKQLNVRWLRAQIGLVSQEPVLFAGTIGWNISMGRDGATQEEVEAAATLSNAAGFVASFPEQYATEVARTPTLIPTLTLTRTEGLPALTRPFTLSRWARRACSCPAGRSSGWRSRAPSCATRPSSCSTRPPRRSTRPRSVWCRPRSISCSRSASARRC